MTIAIQCPNGHKLRASESHAGQRLPCPVCGAEVLVPDATAPSSPSNLIFYLLIGGGVAGAVLGVVLAAVAWRMTNSRGQPAAADVAGSVDVQPPTAEAGPERRAEASVTGEAARAVPEPATGSQSGPDDLNEVTEKLRRIATAFLHFHDTHRIFSHPRAQDFDPVVLDAQPPPTGLSWRVHLLPFLEQKPLYDRFHLDEPWDSPHNKTLLQYMPDVFRIGGGSELTTRFQVITGPNMLFGREKPPRIADLTDGLRHTILTVVTGPDRAIPWTRPDTLPLDPDSPVASLGAMPDRFIKLAMADGKPLILPVSIPSSTFLALATPSGKEIVDADRLRRLSESELKIGP